jgi:hypothetical protein
MHGSESHETGEVEPDLAAPVPVALLRLVLGLLQMGGAVFTLTLLATIGMATWTIGAAVVTTALTAGSSLLFRPAPR